MFVYPIAISPMGPINVFLSYLWSIVTLVLIELPLQKDGFIRKASTCLVCSRFGLRMVRQPHSWGLQNSMDTLYIYVWCCKSQLLQAFGFALAVETNGRLKSIRTCPGSMRGQSSVAKGALWYSWWDMSRFQKKKGTCDMLISSSFLNVSHKKDFIAY